MRTAPKIEVSAKIKATKAGGLMPSVVFEFCTPSKGLGRHQRGRLEWSVPFPSTLSRIFDQAENERRLAA
jgi:hypothetical protein